MKAMAGFRRYGLATISSCAALALSVAFGEPSAWFVLAVLGSTLYSGPGPGILAVALSAGALVSFLAGLHLPLFLVAALAVVAFVELRRSADSKERQAEALFNTRLTVDTIPGMVGTLTPEGEPEFLNQRLLEYVGRTSEQMKDWPAIIHPMDKDRVIEAWLRSMATAAPLEVEHRCLVADGSYRWITNHGLPMLDRNGKILRWFYLITDIDDRKRAEEALRASELNFRTIVESIPGMIVTMTPEGELEFANQQLLSFLGKALEELGDWSQLVHPDDRVRVVSTWRHSLETGQPFEIETRILRADGIYRWVNSHGQPLRGNDDRITRWNNLLTDVNDRKEAEEVLRESESNLRQTVDSIPGFVTMTTTGEIEFANQQLMNFLGKTLDELQDWSPLVHPDDRARVVPTWIRSFETGQPFEFEHRVLRADGTYRWFNSRGEPMRGNDGRILRWNNMHTDISERKEMEEALRNTRTRLSQATQIATVSELSASIAHEINQPLAAVVANGHACSNWLSAQPPNLAKAREAAERIIRDGKEAGEVASRIRALFKRAAIERALLDLNEIIDEVIRLLAGETSKKRIAVETDLENNLPHVMGDRVQLQQLLFNLLLNGIEATDSMTTRPGKLFVRSRREGSEAILVEIRDYGIGLKNPAKIFDAFFTTKQNGMGMGLAICRSIVEAHNGRLWAESNEGSGATFFFTLPTNSKMPI
jgi:PAS domain S-box-containing protein